ncbi:mitochondrial 37S ribosomal protein nam9 [Entophlyctis luteolus]|nr:mitochondrial 37S ribosomal protein nam9 [Entophlyctis luteolus]
MSSGGARIPSRWRVRDPYAPHRQLLRMSWHRLNLFNLATKPRAESGRGGSVFQQKWTAKRELRAYHLPNISEHQLLSRHWRSQLPSSASPTLSSTQSASASTASSVSVPVQALAFAELERRVDTVVFRSHFASSIFQARAFVVQGHVKVNGVQCVYPARRLNPGDMVEVDANMVTTLTPSMRTAQDEKKVTKEEEDAKPDENAPPQAKSEAGLLQADSGVSSSTAGADSPVETSTAKSEGDPQKQDATTVVDAAATIDSEPDTRTKSQKKVPSALAALIEKHPNSRPFTPHPYMAPWMFIPPYLEVCYNTCATIFLRSPLPHASSVEIPSPHPPDLHSLAYEWYSSIKRGKTKRPPPAEPLVVNGRSVRLKSKFDSIMRARLKQERDDRWAEWARRDEAARLKAEESRKEKAVAA